jgi:adenylate cyclase
MNQSLDETMPYYLKQNWKRQLPGLLFTLIAWVLAIGLFGFVRKYGLKQDEFHQMFGMTWRTDMLAHLAAGVLIGLASGIVNILLDTPSVRRLSFGVTILVKSLSFGVVFICTFTLNLLLINEFVPGVINILARLDEGSPRAFITVAFVYAATVNLVVDFVRQVARKLGPRELAKFITGKYHKPREEDRIFMFLDLTSSTSHAERLGHIRYSRLLQDCFFDLTDVVTRFNADVYQYVGDEVVLTWEFNGEGTRGNFLEAQFAFRDILQGKEEYYQSVYGFVPEFKTGAHLGRVTVAEVGEIKREIAFHGDVLNTTARITSKCAEVGARFLVSETMLDTVGKSDRYQMQRIGDVELRGKKKAMSLFAVDRFSENHPAIDI